MEIFLPLIYYSSEFYHFMLVILYLKCGSFEEFVRIMNSLLFVVGAHNFGILAQI